MRPRAIIASVVPDRARPRRLRRRRRRRRRHGRRRHPVVAGEPFPDRPLRGQQGGRHDHATCRASTSPPRRRSSKWSWPTSAATTTSCASTSRCTPSFSTANYPAGRGERGPVLVGRLVHRAGQLLGRQRRRLRRAVDRRPHADRRADGASRAGRVTGRAQRGDDRRQGRAAAGGGGDARRRRPTSPRASSTRQCSSTASTRSPTGSCPGSPAIPGWRSNEPGALERAGLDVRPLRPGRLRHPRLVRRDLHEPHVPGAAPVGGRGLHAGHDARPRRRDRRSGGGGGSRRRADQRQRQPELPVAGGRDVPLGDRRRRRSSTPHPRAATSACRSAPSCSSRSTTYAEVGYCRRRRAAARSKAATTADLVDEPVRRRRQRSSGPAAVTAWRYELVTQASVAGVLDVVLELGDERVDAGELALAAQEVGEPDLGPLAVEVAVEVEQVRLEQRVVGVLVERRPAPEVDRARVALRRRAARTSRRRRRRPAGTSGWAPRRWRSGSRAAGRAGRRRRRRRAPRTAGRAAWPPARRRRRRARAGWRCC